MPAAGADPGPSRLDQETDFHIDSGPLEAALIQFSRQAAVQVVLAPDSTIHGVACAVHGRLAASEALDALLKGTGLIYARVGNTVTVRSAETRNPDAGSRTRIINRNLGRLR